ncbi:MAG TPA: GNAT family N-acetyltransferase, partial [Xanthobacteraceae bacterium]|nr:GNAT family N-acetyltransferase [Xanthobacteraceae bacterium]
MASSDLRIRVVPAIRDIPAAAWDACANPGDGGPSGQGAPFVPEGAPPCLAAAPASVQAEAYNPFISHAFLEALEVSGSASARTGWQPQHLVAESAEGAVLGVVPCYLKSHSRGEYVFDRGWAEAYEHAGGAYYPKLQVSVPFTPATGRRLLARPGSDADDVRAGLAAGLVELTRLRDASSVHVTFAPVEECRLLGERGFLLRTDQQFHWENSGYSSFDDFLGALASRKRKAIKRERREAVAAGIAVEWLTGSELTESVWDAFFAFYMETGSRKWGRPYLTRAFYSLVGEAMGDRIALVMAKRAGRTIAGAINFIGSDALYGRHWGAIEHHPFLHFELCYYQAIEFAIA